MTYATRPVETHVTVCDLCNEIIPKDDSNDRGSLTTGYIAHKVEIPKTSWVYLLWPPAGWSRLKSHQEREQPEWKSRQYDFHGHCILDLVEANLYTTPTPKEKTP